MIFVDFSVLVLQSLVHVEAFNHHLYSNKIVPICPFILFWKSEFMLFETGSHCKGPFKGTTATHDRWQFKLNGKPTNAYELLPRLG